MFMCEDCICKNCPASYTKECGNCIDCKGCNKEITKLTDCIQLEGSLYEASRRIKNR